MPAKRRFGDSCRTVPDFKARMIRHIPMKTAQGLADIHRSILHQRQCRSLKCVKANKFQGCRLAEIHQVLAVFESGTLNSSYRVRKRQMLEKFTTFESTLTYGCDVGT